MARISQIWRIKSTLSLISTIALFRMSITRFSYSVRYSNGILFKICLVHIVTSILVNITFDVARVV